MSREELMRIDGGKKIVIGNEGLTCYNVTYCYKDPSVTLGGTGIVPFQSGLYSDIPAGATNIMPCGMSPVYPFPEGCN